MAVNLTLDAVPPFMSCTEKMIEGGLQRDQLEIIMLLSCDRSSRTQTSTEAERLRWRRECVRICATLGGCQNVADLDHRFAVLSDKTFYGNKSKSTTTLSLPSLMAAVQRSERCAYGDLQSRSLRLLNVLIFLVGFMLIALILSSII